MTRSLPGRSCAACKRRKIRCNREKPCGYCSKLGLECTFPDVTQELSKDARVATPRDPTSRLNRIEHLLLELNDRVRDLDEWRAQNVNDDESQLRKKPRLESTRDVRISRRPSNEQSLRTLNDTGPFVDGHVADIAPEQGSKSRSNKLSDFSYLSRESQAKHPEQCLVLDQSSSARLKDLHPDKSHALALWQVFKHSVDPLLKVLHIPTTERHIEQVIDDPADASFGTQALMFSIYYAAGTSMRYSVSAETLPFEERRQRFSRYDQGIRRTLVQADFIRSPTVMTLQALTMYLVCAQYHGQKSYVWSMMGLLLRLAMKLNLHQDSTDLVGVELEIRRRLWWAIVVLDFQIADVSCTKPFIYEHISEVHLPLDVDDSQLGFGQPLSAEVGIRSAEMLFTLSRIQIVLAAREIARSSENGGLENDESSASASQGHVFGATLVEIERRSLLQTKSAKTINHFTAIASRVLVARLRLGAIKRSTYGDSSKVVDQDLTSDIQQIKQDIEGVNVLQTNTRYNSWAWILDVEGIAEFVEKDVR